jgi:hypothetical protein
MDDPSGRQMLNTPKSEFGRRQPMAKTIFDGTKLPLVVEHLKTPTYGMRLAFSPERDASELRLT